jgi:hypothetical protein
MAHYKVIVFERVIQEYEYEVEANSAEEAKRNALDGLYEIRELVHPGRADLEPHREVYGEPELIDEVNLP